MYTLILVITFLDQFGACLELSEEAFSLIYVVNIELKAILALRRLPKSIILGNPDFYESLLTIEILHYFVKGIVVFEALNRPGSYIDQQFRNHMPVIPFNGHLV